VNEEHYIQPEIFSQASPEKKQTFFRIVELVNEIGVLFSLDRARPVL